MGRQMDKGPVSEHDVALVADSGLFNKSYYLEQCPRLAGKDVDLLTHYLLIGKMQGISPNPGFDVAFYRQAYADQLDERADPFLHYIQHGAKAGLLLRPTRQQELEEIPAFRYQALNCTLIDWRFEERKTRDPNLISIIIPVFNQPQLTLDCLQAVYQQTSPGRFEVIAVDNGSDYPTQDLLQELSQQHPGLQVIRNQENLNFALGCNIGFAASRGATVIFLNNDTRVTANWLEALIAPLQDRKISAIQPRLLYPDGTIQSMGIVFSNKSPLGYSIYQGMKPAGEWAEKSRPFQAVTGACMTLRAEDFAKMRGFSPAFINGQEDVDLCLRLNQQGNRHCWLAADVSIIHVAEASSGRLAHVIHNRKEFIKRWKSSVVADDLANFDRDSFEVSNWRADSAKNQSQGVEIYLPELQYRSSVIPKAVQGTSRIKQTISGSDKDIINSAPWYFEAAYYRAQLNKPVATPLLDHFVQEGWKAGLSPSSLFDTSWYLEQNPDVKDSGINPLVHYIQKGYREGRPAACPIKYMREHADITIPVSADIGRFPSIAVVLHLFYPDLLESICSYLGNIPYPFDLYVTTTKAAKGEIQEKLSARFPNLSIIVTSCENRGRDIAPFLNILSEHHDQYDLICKIHGKKSTHDRILDSWRAHLLDNLLGSEEIVRTIVCSFDTHDVGIIYPALTPKLGIVVSQDTCWGHAGNNFRLSLPLLSRLGIASTPVEKFGFPAGSMFWCRPAAIRPLIELGLEPGNFEVEQGQKDGTLAHALERLFGLVTRHQGYQLKSVYLSWRNDPEFPAFMARYLDALPFPLSGFKQVIHHKPAGLLPLYGHHTTAKLRIHWVVPHFNIGNGGHMTIFRIAKYLESFGHEITIWVHSRSERNQLADDYRTLIRTHYQPLQAKVFRLGNSDTEINRISGDVLIATDRMSVYPVMAMHNFRSRFYFVQDYEPYFYAVSTEYFLSKNTYNMGLDCLCASEWLCQLINEKHGQWTATWPLAVDGKIYRHSGQQRIPALIAFYTRRRTPRRLVELGFLALHELFARGYHFQVHMFGDDKPAPLTPYPIINRGVLDTDALSELYNTASIGMVFSGTNHSLIPNEMMACGLPVIDIEDESTQLAYPPGTVCKATPSVTGVADMLAKLLTDSGYWQQCQTNGLAYMQGVDWSNSARIVETAIIKRFRELLRRNKSPTPGTDQSICASVIIPTFNGGKRLAEVVDAVAAQATPWYFEILLIDSGSTDGSLHLLKNRDDIRIHHISQSDFGHGRTRNLGVELTKGEFVAFLTQDAMPANCYWLLNLVQSMASRPQCAGAFGKHLAYPEHSTFLQRDLSHHFDNWIGKGPEMVSKETAPEKYSNDQGWRNFCHAFSNNNACLRRNIWKSIPFRDVPYGEDQLWARDILEQGFTKLYVPDAQVYHSHDWNFRQTLQRAITEGLYFKQYFGFDLCKSKTDAKEKIRLLNEQDSAFARENNIPESELERRKKMNFARISGFYLAGKGVGKMRA